MIFFAIEIKEEILKDFDDHNLKYMMKYEFFDEVFYLFKLTIQVLIFQV
jgi:hypothetical protein